MDEKMDMAVGQSSEEDRRITARLAGLAGGRDFTELLQTFPAYIRRINLTRFLAYYELFRMIKDKPGWIVECGIYRGFSFFSLGKFLEIFCMGDKTRKLLGFDNFQGFTALHEKDGAPDPKVTRTEGGTNPQAFREEFQKLLELNNADCFAPWAERMLVVEGDARETIPAYCAENPGLRISMLHIDIDIYEPVKVAISHLYPKVIPGGLVVLDEYAHKDWPGESTAVEEYFKESGIPPPELRSLPWVGTPTTYFFKGDG